MTTDFNTAREMRTFDGEFMGLTKDDRLALGLCLVSSLLAFSLRFPVVKLILAIILVVPFIRLSLKHFYLAVSLFVFSLPFHDLALNGSLLVPGLNIQTGYICFLLFLAWRHSNAQETREEDSKVNPALAPLVGLFLVVMISTAHSALVSQDSLFDLLTRAKNWFAYAIFAHLTFKYVHDRREKLVILIFVLGTVFLNVLWSLRNVSQQLFLFRDRAASLVIPGPNLYAGFLALYLFFFLAFILYYPLSRKAKISLAIVTTLVGINLIYTLSRGAWIACAVSLLFVMAMKAKKLIIPIVLGLVGLYFWTPQVAVERWGGGFVEEYDLSLFTAEDHVTYSEAATRVIQWKNFPTMLAENPVIGMGFGQYHGSLFERGLTDNRSSAHSTIVEIGVEEGLLGLGFYLLLLFTIYREASRIFRQASFPIDKVLALGLVGATVCLLILDCSGTRFRNVNVMAYYWILTGITLNASIARERHAFLQSS